MRVFVEVAREGSIAAASRKLAISPPSASRLLSDLEGWLDQPLIRRSTRKLSLTSLGERYLQRCIDIVERTEALKADAEGHSAVPSGQLRVTVASILARRVVSRIIPRFLESCPKVTLHLDTNDRVVDLLSERMDLAIRIGNLDDSRLVVRKMFGIRSVLVASPDLLTKYGRPTEVSKLTDIPCLVDTVPSFGAHWPILNGKLARGPVEVSDGEIIRDLAVAGLGVAYIPEIFVDNDLKTGTLEELLTDCVSEEFGVFAVFPPREFISPAARAFAIEVESSWVEPL